MGGICAQGLLTLIPIAPPGWGVPFLILTGGSLALWALQGFLRVLSKYPALALDDRGLEVEGRRVLWAEIEHYRIDREAGAIALGFRSTAAARAILPPHRRLLARAGLLPRRANPGLPARQIDAGLTEIAAAFRDVRPDLETRP